MSGVFCFKLLYQLFSNLADLTIGPYFHSHSQVQLLNQLLIQLFMLQKHLRVLQQIALWGVAPLVLRQLIISGMQRHPVHRYIVIVKVRELNLYLTFCLQHTAIEFLVERSF